MIDIASWLAGTGRDVEKSADGGYEVILRRRYDHSADKVWAACTAPEHLKEWFLAVSGDLKLGGKFQLEGNAGGDILECDAPNALRITWVYGDHTPQKLSLRLEKDGDGSVLELRHIDPGDAIVDLAFAVGPGWDAPVIAVGKYLDGNMPERSWWMESPEAIQMITGSIRAWQAALTKSGVADQEAIDKAAAASLGFYTGAAAPAE